MSKKKILELGPGTKPAVKRSNQYDVIYLDMVRYAGVDKVHNLEKFPYPFKNNEFDVIIAYHVIEHLKNTIKVMEELHRITKNGGLIKIKVPHVSSFMALGHLTHKRAFSTGTFNNFTDKNWEKYSHVKFDIVKIKLHWFRMRRYPIISQINWLVEKIININHMFSERFLSFPLCGFDEIYYEIRVRK
ncbi:MAG: hypothetical protein DRM99_00475 [Thermoplasmata archaeon]|nr:MAG: hypothetical protein DRM99_00475 [Thermoplasmata archaeon]